MTKRNRPCAVIVASHKKSPPENYGKEDQTTVAAFLPWRGLSVLDP
jgi:hypothetical protein